MDQLPMLITSTEMGSYIKWSLLLQEQLAGGMAHLNRLQQLRDRLQRDNEALRAASTTVGAASSPRLASMKGRNGSTGSPPG